MKKLLGLALVLGALAFGARAEATTCTVAHVFVTSEILTNTVLNANPSALVACANSIDNANIGANGIFASQIKPTSTAQATFSASSGWTIATTGAAQVALTVSSAGTPSVDTLDVVTNAVKSVFVDKNGVLNTTLAPVFGAAPTFSTPLGTASGGTGTTTGFGSGVLPIVNGGTGAASLSAANIATTNTSDTFSGNIASAARIWASPSGTDPGLGATGDIIATRSATGGKILFGTATGSFGAIDYGLSNAGTMTIIPGTFLRMMTPLAAASDSTTLAFVPPLYGASGAALSSTSHSVMGSTASIAAGSQVTVTLSGAAVFSSATSYSCTANWNDNSPRADNIAYVYGVTSGSSFIIANTTGNSHTASFFCTGS